MKFNHFQFNSSLSPPHPESRSVQLYIYCKKGEKGDKGGGRQKSKKAKSSGEAKGTKDSVRGGRGKGGGGGAINSSTIKSKSPQPVP